jgi:hypothetical protein
VRTSLLRLLVPAAAAAVLFTTGAQSIAAPTAPVASSPCAGTSVDSLGAFKWGAVASATHYEYWVSGDSAFQTPAYGSSNGPNEFTTNNTRGSLLNTLANGTYWWKVRALNASNTAGAWSSACSFNMDWADQPALVAPDDTATVTYPTPLLLNWNPVNGAARYSVNVSQQPDMSTSLSGFPVTTSATAYSPTSQLDNGTYYWQVTPIDGDQAQDRGAPSEIRSFTWSWPSTATTLSVTDLDSSPEVFDPQFSWTPIPGAKSYQLQVNSDDSFSAPPALSVSTIISTNYSPTQLLPADTYYWRIRAQDANGHFGAWVVAPGTLPSSTFTNNYDTSGISGLTMVDTSGNSVWASSPLSTDTPIVSWSATPGAESYLIDVVPFSSGLCQWGSGAPSAWHDQTAATAWTPLGDGLSAGNPFPNPGHSSPTTDSSALAVGQSYCVRVRAQRASDSSGQQVYGTYSYLGGSGNPAFTFTGYPAGSACSAPCNSAINIGAADYILPAATGNTSLPLFTWKPIAGVQSYFVIIATDNTFQHVIDEAFTHVDAYAPRANLGVVNYPDTNTTYAWAVLPAANYDGSSAGGDPTTAGSYPQTFDFHSVQPSPIAPLTGDTVTTQPTFSWTPVAGADHYELQVATDSGFGNTVGGTPITTNATSYTGTNFPAGNLYWRVHALDASGNGLSWTTPQQFTKTFAAPTFTGNGSTYNDPTSTDGIPRLQWDAMPGATSYEVKIYHGSSSPMIDQTVQSTVFVPTSLAGTGHFTWTVYANYPTSSNDVESPPSATQAVDRVIAAPGGLTGGTATQHSMLLSWNSKAGAASYAVQIATDNQFTNVFDNYHTEITQLAPSLSDFGGNYANGGPLYWRIAAIDADGNQGAWSSAQSVSLPVQIHASSPTVIVLHKSTTTVKVFAKTGAGKAISGVTVTDTGCGVTKASKKAGASGAATFKVHPTKTGKITFTLSRTGYLKATMTVQSY